ncbi:hypothetical protein ACGY0I_15650, partial [Burkholderia pseudomallei]
LRRFGASALRRFGASALRRFGTSALRRFGTSALRHFGTSAPRPYYVRHPFRPTPLHLVALPDSSIHGGYHPIHQPIAG